jgi:hypothetical protein
MSMMVICAWCGKMVTMKGGAREDRDTHPVSHTICSKCKAKVLERFKRPSK